MSASRGYSSWLGFALVALAAIALAGCANDGSDGKKGKDGESQGTVQGTVTNGLTAAGVAGATVTFDPAVVGPLTTGAGGTYSAMVPVGLYAITTTAPNFTAKTTTVSVLAGLTATGNVSLAPTAPVLVDAGSTATGSPGGAVNLAAKITVMDGSTVQSIQWTQENSVEVSIAGATTANPTVTLPGLATYKAELIHVLSEPPIGEADLPPNVELPEEFPGGLQDRFGVVGINPFALEETAKVVLKLTVTTTSGVYADTVEIDAILPWKVASGLRNVPVGIPVLLNGKDQASYAWTLKVPGGSTTAALDDPASQHPWFTPDTSGQYTVTETVSGQTFDVFAGLWSGAITGKGADGMPLAVGCTSCHNDSIAPDKFTPWRQSGHAHILSTQLDTSTHYSTGCFSCHTVGYDPAVANGGIDEASDYPAFLSADYFHKAPGDNWTQVVTKQPNTAKLANIQCENCHGPQGGAHFQGDPRISLSADLCGTCHGEPLRHARFQQWQLSKHANYELAGEEGSSGSCSRCHTANGFLAWLPLIESGNAASNVTVTWSKDEIHPQTCVTCHDPHNPGTSTADETDAKARIYGNTPLLLAGFRAYGVGSGAICMTCHNTRRGLTNDEMKPTMDDQEAHAGAQADMLMGQNVFFVQVGTRSPHSLIEDTCVGCHMEKTPPPALLSYNLGGTNHTFAANRSICSECHGNFDGEGLGEATEALLEELKGAIEEAILQSIRAYVAGGDDVYVMSGSTTLAVIDEDNVDTISGPTEADDETLQEEGMLVGSHGRQAVSIRAGGTMYSHVRIGDLRVGGASGPMFYETSFDGSIHVGQFVVKAGWNYFMIENDSSRGAHNPALTLDVIDKSRTKMQQVLDAAEAALD